MMKLLEYEAKTLLRTAEIPTPDSMIVVESTLYELQLPVVLKSQVPIGGRGKLGGVVIMEDKSKVAATIKHLFDLDIRGFKPNVLLAERVLLIQNEYYFSIIINKTTSSIELIAHKNGGVDVEVNEHDSFLHVTLNGKNAEEAGELLAEYLDIPGQTFALQDLVENAYQCFVINDATLLEINPLVITDDSKLVAGDCKMELDDAAAFRHPEWNFNDVPSNSNFVVLNELGTVATIANGAGLAMATVDAVTDAGMTPANFLDIGGGANAESVLTAFERIMLFSNVQAIVINIFAGITRCDEVAKAIIIAKKQMTSLPPLFIRLTGTNFEVAVELLENENIQILQTLEGCVSAAKEVHHG